MGVGAGQTSHLKIALLAAIFCIYVLIYQVKKFIQLSMAVRE
jgi:hypothetical protein